MIKRYRKQVTFLSLLTGAARQKSEHMTPTT
jgi:hypothetical protein